jgi:hypothetical protein
MKTMKEHQFRPGKLHKRWIEDVTNHFAKGEGARYEEWSSYRKHKRVIDDAIAAQVVGEFKMNPTVKASLTALEAKAQERVALFREIAFERTHTFDLHPGLNVLGPPYDFTLSDKRGSQKPSVSTSDAHHPSFLPVRLRLCLRVARQPDRALPRRRERRDHGPSRQREVRTSDERAHAVRRRFRSLGRRERCGRRRVPQS